MDSANCNTFILITGRSRSQAISMESDGKLSDEYEKHVAIAYMNPADIERLKLNGMVRIVSNGRGVVLPVKGDGSLPKGIVFMPLGPWANILVPSASTLGTPNYKFVEVCVEGVQRDSVSIHLEDIFVDIGKRITVYMGSEIVGQGNDCNENIKLTTCTFCGLVCSGIAVKVGDNRVVEVLDGCSISASKFTNTHRNRILRPIVRTLDGFGFSEVDLATAIDRATDILVSSRHPLIYGLSSTSTEAVEIAVEIAKILGGTIDSTASVCHGPTILSLDYVKLKNFRLEMLNNIETVVIWGANPAEAHPKLIPILKKCAKNIVVIDVRESETMKIADTRLIIRPGSDLELIRAVRLLLRGYRIDLLPADVDVNAARKLAEIFVNSRKGVILFGIGLTMNRTKFVNTLELAKLVEELNTYGEWYLQPLRGHFNVTGTNIVLRNFTGYPFAVDFSSGVPFMAPGVTTAVDLLKNRDVDSVMVVASDPVAHMPIECVKALAELPLIVIDCRWTLTASLADVVIPTGLIGIECSGTVYRMDGEMTQASKVAPFLESLPCDVDVLKMLFNSIVRRLGRA